MIIRILGEGRFDVPERAVPQIARRYHEMQDASRTGDANAFAYSLPALLVEVRRQGEYLGMDTLGDVDAMLPPANATIHDARVVGQLVAQLHAGIVPG